MARAHFGEIRTPIVLSILMILMTQVGYLDVLNTWSEGDHTLDATTTAFESGSGSSQSNFTASAEGAELLVGQAMTNITFQYNPSLTSDVTSSSSFAYANNKVSAGMQHTCAILGNGSLMCWGGDTYGQVGDGGSNSPTASSTPVSVDLGTGRTALAVSLGYQHTCAILDNGDLKCWGRDTQGAVGDGMPLSSLGSPTSVDLGTGRTAVAVSAGYLHTCAILDTGDLKCWGSDNNGQLGDGGTVSSNAYTSAPSSTAIDLGTGRTAVAVSAGWEHTCAVLDNGDMKCWGDDSKGQLGDGGTDTDTSAPSSTAIDLGTGRTAVALDVGNTHTCAILDNGEAKCWGSDFSGQLGDGGTTHNAYTYTAAPSSTAIDLGTGRTAVALSAGGKSTCAILDNGEAKCWGEHDRGLLGLGSSSASGSADAPAPLSTAIDFGTGRTAVAIVAGGEHACALLNDGNLSCWGNDNNGRLGNGGSNVDKWGPDLVGSGTWDSSTGAMIDVTGATCTVSPSLPAGLSIDSSTCTISGTPTVPTSNTTYTVTAVINGATYQLSMQLSTSHLALMPSVDGADLIIDEAMTNITFQYNSSAASGSSGGMTNVTGAT